MRYSWPYTTALVFVLEAAVAQRVLQGSVQHFQSETAGPWQPLLTLGFGTPPQEITGIFDSGSSDTIIPKAGSALCQVKNQQCTDGADVVRGEFNEKQAEDVEKLRGDTFNASFSGGDEFDGEYIKTTVTVIGGAGAGNGTGGAGGTGNITDGEVTGAQVALASDGQPSGNFPQFAIYGVGPRELEATDQKYDNLPQVMKDTGAIKGNSYSVVLNPTPLANGSVFFGGIDRSKFTGELQQVPIDRANSGKIVDFVAKMSSLRLDMSGGNNQTGRLAKDQQRERMRLRRSVRRRRISRSKGYSKAQGKYGGGQAGKEDGQAVSVLGTAEGSHNSNGNRKGNNRGNSNGDNNDGNCCSCSCNNNNNNNGDSGRGNRNKDKGNNGDDNNGNDNNGDGSGIIDLGLTEKQSFTLFDTGGVDVSLPANAMRKLARALDTDFDEEEGGLGPIDCGLLSAGNKIVMGFDDDRVQTTLALDKIRLSEEQTDSALTRQGLCQVGVFATPKDAELNNMGFPFYTDVYTVFDLENNSLWFAQAKGDPGAPGEQLEEFP